MSTKADLRTLNSVIARSGRFDVARPDIAKEVYVVLCEGEEMERFGSFTEAADACDKRK
jgi:hypothetical protein